MKHRFSVLVLICAGLPLIALAGPREDAIRKFVIETIIRQNGYPDIEDKIVEMVAADEILMRDSKALIAIRAETGVPYQPFGREEILQLVEDHLKPQSAHEDGFCDGELKPFFPAIKSKRAH